LGKGHVGLRDHKDSSNNAARPSVRSVLKDIAKESILVTLPRRRKHSRCIPQSEIYFSQWLDFKQLFDMID
jgi:hypothetical protein